MTCLLGKKAHDTGHFFILLFLWLIGKQSVLFWSSLLPALPLFILYSLKFNTSTPLKAMLFCWLPYGILAFYAAVQDATLVSPKIRMVRTTNRKLQRPFYFYYYSVWPKTVTHSNSSWSAFCFAYSTLLPCHHNVELMQCHQPLMDKPCHSVHWGSRLTSLCCLLKHINHCSNFPMVGSYLF